MWTAFVTGCGSGFGARLARRLLADGHRVIATDPDPSTLRDLRDRPDALVRALDVRDAESVRAAVADALAWGPPDVLVNNAGYAVFGTQEEADLDAVRDMFEVNVFGAGRVTAALLPALRARRGCVVQLSSVAGRTVFPESGWYAASKHALEAMSEALFQECATFGVRVRVVEPGSFATGFQARAAAASRPRDPASAYAARHPMWDARKLEVLEPPQDPDRVVDAILAALADPAPFRRVVVGPDAERILALRDQLGPDAFSRLSAARNGLVHPACDGDVLGPGEVLQVLAGAPGEAAIERLRPTLLALHLGHLGHWAHDAEGAAALAAMDAIFAPVG